MDWFEIENQQKYYDDMQAIKIKLLNKEIPEIYPREVARQPSLRYLTEGIFVDRKEFIRISSFALISNSWLKPLAEYINGSKCLEIMAGRGVLSKGLSNLGVDIVATDDFSWRWSRGEGEERIKLNEEDLWFEVEKLDCVDAIEKYGTTVDYIICCWPYMDNSAYKSLIKMREINKTCRLIYIGEESGGCTADDAFHESAKFIEDDKIFERAANRFQYWFGIYDRLSLVL